MVCGDQFTCHISLRKLAHAIYRDFQLKKKSSEKNDTFNIFAQTIDWGFTIRVPTIYVLDQNRYTPVNPIFTM